MIQYLCDRCKAVLKDPVDSLRSNLIDGTVAKCGVILRLPIQVAARDKESGFRMDIVHFCQSCLEDLAVWRSKSKEVDHTMVDDR